MCGIAGYLNFDKESISSKILKKMVISLKHRGPDSDGIFIDNSCGLAHTRLSIIDTSSAGDQPMFTEDKRYVLVYNGELFNFNELREELKSSGWKFSSNTDTEVVLKSLAKWGTKALNKFNGQFALAFWDKITKKLIIARDRYGIKPLYFSKFNNKFIFGSEIKAILTHPDVKLDINKKGLIEYMTFQNFLTDNTLFKNIEIIMPGSWMTISSNGKVEKNVYWDFNFIEPKVHNAKNISVYKEELDFLLNQAVKRQLVSDVEVGSYLSGGMDSGTIASIASKEIVDLKTFTCGFDTRSASGIELGMDERDVAEYMSYLYKTEHYQVVLKSGDMERILPKLVRHIEEPRVGQSYPNFYVSQLASKFCKVVLSGTGGDELFGGYPWRYYRAVNNENHEDYVKKYFKFWQRMIPNDSYKEVLKPLKHEMSNYSTEDVFKNIFTPILKKKTTPEDYINYSLYFEAKTFLHGLLVVEDKLSMANSLETRVPFLDNDLVDFASKIPVNLKLGNLQEVIKLDENTPGLKNEKYFQKTKDGKLILRKVMEKYVPQDISNGIKKGFSGPDSSWFKGESIDYVNSKLMVKNAKIYNYLDRKSIQDLLNDHFIGRNNRRLLIWSLINLEIWLDMLDNNKWSVN